MQGWWVGKVRLPSVASKARVKRIDWPDGFFFTKAEIVPVQNNKHVNKTKSAYYNQNNQSVVWLNKHENIRKTRGMEWTIDKNPLGIPESNSALQLELKILACDK